METPLPPAALEYLAQRLSPEEIKELLGLLSTTPPDPEQEKSRPVQGRNRHKLPLFSEEEAKDRVNALLELEGKLDWPEDINPLEWQKRIRSND